MFTLDHSSLARWWAGAVLALAFASFAGCASSGGATGAGAPSGLNTLRGPATRAHGRTADKAMRVNPGYERYLVRLAERRAERGLQEPVELRIARRRERYKSVFAVLSDAAKTVDKEVINPVTRRIPWFDKKHDATLSGATDTFKDHTKAAVDPTATMLQGIFKPLGTHRGAKK